MKWVYSEDDNLGILPVFEVAKNSANTPRNKVLMLLTTLAGEEENFQKLQLKPSYKEKRLIPQIME